MRAAGKNQERARTYLPVKLLSYSISSSFSCIIVRSVSMLLHSKFSIRSFKASSSFRIFLELSSVGLSAFSSSVGVDINVMLSVDMIVAIVCWISLSYDSKLSIAFCTLSMSV